jgi:hypothetical protein
MLNWLHDAVATVLRSLPWCWSLLGLPARSIPSLNRWIESYRVGTHDRWQVTRGPHYEALHGPVTVRRLAPKTIDGRPLPHELTVDQHTVHAELFLAVLSDARVLGPNGTVITPDGRVVCESTWPRRRLRRERVWTALSLPRCRFLAGRYYTIASPHWSAYYHWVTEVLPRLSALDTLIGDDVRILINSPLNAWQRQSLELLGYGARTYISLGEQYVRAEMLYLPSFVGDPSPHPFACRWLRERLLPVPDPTAKPRRLYVTRRLARGRRVANEQELEPILINFGFEIIEAESLTFLEQVCLFSQAEVVAGPHGAGLCNVLFAPAGCKVLEFFQPSYVLASTYKIATCLDQEYGFLFGRAIDSTSADTANTANMIIDHEAFGSCLEAMIAEPSRRPGCGERDTRRRTSNGCSILN